MVADDASGDEVGERLAYLLKRAHATLAVLHEELLAPFDIGAGELAVLMLIQAHEAESQQQVARRLGIDRTTMVELIDVLEDKGLVTRRPDAADRRRKVIQLTARGRATLPVATRASDEAERRLLAALDEDERIVLRDLMRRLVAAPEELRRH